ncbi:glycosyltransferase family 2 protein [Paenibacillus polymyxa]|uniref:glycosyltransferase family 2 protein n=1 Tax=Paenibacillus polymyxa TaxID=1406 RepID=UPI002AB4C339|nr:glycosyltransferase family 2 protein [Paenibacillus polymyxa]MDY8044694.1 glycosyltransferase family 2 protein [Paenibacillus polymyxa]
MGDKLRWQVGGVSIRQTKRRIKEERQRIEQLQQQLEAQRSEQAPVLYKLDFHIEELERRLQDTELRIQAIQNANDTAAAVEQLLDEGLQDGQVQEAQVQYASGQEQVAAGTAMGAASSISGTEVEETARGTQSGRNGKARLGDQLVENGMITRDQLTDAIRNQKRYGGRLGDILVEMGFITAEQLQEQVGGDESKERLGDMLVRSGYILPEQLERALEFQAKSGGLLGDILLSLQMLEPADLYRAIATQNRIGRIGEELALDAAYKLPEQVAMAYGVVVIHQYMNRYIVAVSDPLPEERRLKLEGILGMPVEQVLATKEEMEQLWGKIYGEEMMQESTTGLLEKEPHNSARTTFTKGQLWVFAAMGMITLLGLLWNSWKTVLIINMMIQLFYFAMTLFKFGIIYLGSRRGAQLRFTKEEVDAMDEKKLPIYTILVPMYKEAGVLPMLLRNLEQLDYPKSKLDVRLLIEEDDIETIELLREMKLPAYYTTLVVPDGLPKTKPKACNYGLIRARGEFVVIYDAEDRPDADQLKKVIAAFDSLPEHYACIQAKLNYFNSTQNLLTRWFTQEYSMWFELLLPGIMQLDTPIPLGGTSNHFRVSVLKDINAWDPYNVTEDADLGIRLYKGGYKTAIVDSRTWEEANSRVGNWIRQRSRWIKGYMQTWLVHMRNPVKLVREVGWKGFFGFQVMILATPMLPLLNPIFWGLLILWFGWELSFIPKLFPGYVYYLASAEFYIGNFLFVFSNVAGMYWVIGELEERGERTFSYAMVKYGLLSPLYWVLMSIAAVKAAWQLITKPFYWEKTTHGLTDMHDLDDTPAQSS